jgi:hypothetical protein
VNGQEEGWGYAETDNNGVYKIQGLEVPGTYKVKARAAGYSSSAEQTVSLGTGQNVQVDFTLVAAGKITGMVTDASTGAPIADALVYAWRQAAPNPADRYDYTDANGQYVLNDLDAPDTYNVTVEASGYPSQTQSSIQVNGGQEVSGVNFFL